MDEIKELSKQQQLKQEHFERVREAYAKSVENAVKKIFIEDKKNGRIGSPEPGNRNKEL